MSTTGLPNYLGMLDAAGSIVPSSPSTVLGIGLAPKGQSVWQTMKNNFAGGGGSGGTGFFSDPQRAVTVIIGLILIGAGVFMFKPVRETIVTTAKTAAKAAA